MTTNKKPGKNKGFDRALSTKSLSEFVEKQVEVDEFFKLRDKLPYKCEVESISVRKGKDSDFLIVIGRDIETGNSIGFSCGSIAVMRKLHEVEDNKGFPCIAEFFQPKGERYYDVR